MFFSRALLAVASVMGLVAVSAPAWAEHVDLMSSDGPLRLEVSRSGEVTGSYASKDGEMRGRASANGDLNGIWMQPRSDHPCQEARDGTYSWGSFRITGIYGRNPAGYWGYCGERADRDWHIRR